jgi:hypothetical protein
MGPLLAGLGLGIGVALWTQRPVLVDQHSGAFLLFFLLALVLAWVGGSRRAASAAAVAIAQAHADARAASEAAAAATSDSRAVAGVNVFLTPDGQPRRPTPGEAVAVGLERAEWYGQRDHAEHLVGELEERASDDGLGELLSEHQEQAVHHD